MNNETNEQQLFVERIIKRYCQYKQLMVANTYDEQQEFQQEVFVLSSLLHEFDLDIKKIFV